MNIQDEVQKIHAQFGTSELANYKIQLLFDSERKVMQEDHQREMDEVLHSAIRTIKELLPMAEVPDKDRSYYYQHLQDYLTNFKEQDK